MNGDIEYGNFGGGLMSVGHRVAPGAPVRKSAALSGMITPAIQGWACVYNKPHSYKSRIEIFSPGAFDATLAARDVVEFRVDHDPGDIIASTADRLELLSDRTGLAFRMKLRDDGIGDLVLKRQADAMSPGYKEIDVEEVEIEGEKVRMIRKAALTEISLVRRGAVRQTFATLVDAAKCAPLSVETKGSGFGVEASYRRLMRVLEDVGDRS